MIVIAILLWNCAPSITLYDALIILIIIDKYEHVCFDLYPFLRLIKTINYIVISSKINFDFIFILLNKLS